MRGVGKRMGTTGSNEERTDQDITNSEHGDRDAADNGTQPETTVETHVRRIKPEKKHLPKIAGKYFLLVVVGGTLGLILLLLISRMSVFAISGNSMEPALSNGDSVILRQGDGVEAGQIVFFRPPKEWRETFKEINGSTMVKRIAAVPGDTIEFNGKEFIINGGERRYELPEGYDCEAAPRSYKSTLSPREAFVLGDNASNSIDSRYVFCKGYLNMYRIHERSVIDYGKIIFKW